MRPYGYEPDRHTIREPEAEVLRDAGNRLLDGESLRSVAKYLNDSGARTATGKLWEAKTLRRTLAAPRIAGKRMTRSGKLATADWPAIIDAVTHRRLQALLAKNTEGRPPAPTSRRYLLGGGIAVCGLCGKPLAARPNNNGRRGYACIVDPPNSGCGRIRIAAEAFENDVAERTLARLLRDDNRVQLNAAMDAAQQAAVDAEITLANVQGRQQENGIAFAEGKVTATEMHAASARLQEQAADARAAIRLAARLENLSVGSASSMVTWWEGASVEQQATLLRLLIERVEVYPATVRGSKLYDSSRVKVIWRGL